MFFLVYDGRIIEKYSTKDKLMNNQNDLRYNKLDKSILYLFHYSKKH